MHTIKYDEAVEVRFAARSARPRSMAIGRVVGDGQARGVVSMGNYAPNCIADHAALSKGVIAQAGG